MYGSNAFPIGPNGEFIYKERVDDFGNYLPTEMYTLEDEYDEYNAAAQIPAPEKNFDSTVFGARQKLQTGRTIREGLDEGADSGFSPRYGRKYTSGSSDIGMSGHNVGKAFYEDQGLGKSFHKKWRRRIKKTGGKITRPVARPVNKVVPGGKIVYKASQVHGLGEMSRPMGMWGPVVPKVIENRHGMTGRHYDQNTFRTVDKPSHQIGWWDRLFGGYRKHEYKKRPNGHRKQSVEETATTKSWDQGRTEEIKDRERRIIAARIRRRQLMTAEARMREDRMIEERIREKRMRKMAESWGPSPAYTVLTPEG